MAQDTATAKENSAYWRRSSNSSKLRRDPNSRALAKELLESLMALHGAGLERILELAAEEGDSGAKLIEKCGRDELVSSLLLLYGLHPDDLATRVERALEKTRPFLAVACGASANWCPSARTGRLPFALQQSASGCGSTAATVRSTLEAAIQDAAPDATSDRGRGAGGGRLPGLFRWRNCRAGSR